MARWDPDAVGRLRTAAMELFAELGYEQTSVAAIAERAGLTARTFFRHFSDKKEVLFDGSEQLRQLMVRGAENAPRKAGTWETIAAALMAAAALFDEDRRTFARQRHALIAANADLLERELIKLSTLAAALVDALHTRGVEEPDAGLAGECGIAIFQVVFRRWIARGEKRSFNELLVESLHRWQTLSTARLKA